MTFRQLLGMQSGVSDYYMDGTGWLKKTVLGSTRDVEPLEFLAHMTKSFVFSPGDVTTAPNGMAVKRASYSTNGFSLVGLALCGLLGVNDWADLDLKQLVWGDKTPADDLTVFATRGPCSRYPHMAHQYFSGTADFLGIDFHDIIDTSCLNSWLGKK